MRMSAIEKRSARDDFRPDEISVTTEQRRALRVAHGKTSEGHPPGAKERSQTPDPLPLPHRSL